MSELILLWASFMFGALFGIITMLLNYEGVPRNKIDKAIKEIEDYAEFHNRNLYRENLNYDIEQGRYLAYKKSLEIIKRNIGGEDESISN